MSALLCFSIRFLQPYTHGRGESGKPEWPPSPLRLVQALLAAGAGHWNERRVIRRIRPALQWLEALPCPQIQAPTGISSEQRRQSYVPDNTADLLVPAWKKGEFTKQSKRTEKVVCPTHFDGEAVHYLYPLHKPQCPHLEILTSAARSITHLGWGIDMAIGDVSIITDEEAAQLAGHRWRPTPTGGMPLRTPKRGTFDDLVRKHADFLGRVTDECFRPVPPLSVFNIVRYRRHDEPLQRPFRVFDLRNIDGSRFHYPHRKLIHIAGMVRHLAIKMMKKAPPSNVGRDWVESFIAGHRKGVNVYSISEIKRGDGAENDRQREEITDSHEHSQLSYIPLTSISHQQTDPGIRQVMVVAPVSHEDWLDHVALRLAGQTLQAQRGDEFVGREPPILVPVRGDGVAPSYTEPASTWHSLTPVILPGHDDHKAAKTRMLIERTLTQSGIDQPCEFEWSSFSRFPMAYSAHKYGRDKQHQGYIRPNYLLSQTAVHLTLRFHNGSTEKKHLRVPGPLIIGAGRHCGFGLMAALKR